MELIDTHCHLTTLSPEQVIQVLERARQCSVVRMLCVGASEGVESAAQAVSLSRKFPEIWASVGIHPHDAGKGHSLASIASLAEDPRVLAIGETGLDYFRDWSPFEEQRSLFRSTIALARQVKKPLIIHCRDAEEDTLRILQEERAAEVGGVFHCYAGNADFARVLRSINFLVSFTGNITFKKASTLREAVQGIPLEQMMVETDSPYMAPEPHRGKPSEPMHVYQVALKIAELKNLSLEQVARSTTESAEQLFRFPQSSVEEPSG